MVRANWRGVWMVVLVLAAALFAAVSQAQPQSQGKPVRRMALVIGNDAYQSVSKLQKAGNDAAAMARELRAAGFDVTLARDLNYRAMVRTVDGFAGKLASGDQVVVFYAGHGVQIRAGSYLLPVDIEAGTESEIEKTAYGLNDLTEKLSDAKAAFTLVLVDACRDNPLRTNGRSVGVTRGLSAIEPPRGQMVVYSASRGQQALDRLNDRDANPNGVFTREFIARMRQPGVRIEDMVREVQDSVESLAKTVGHDQRPAIYNEARGNFYFFAPTVARATAPPLPAPSLPAAATTLPAAPTPLPADGIGALRRSASAGDQVAMLSLGDRLAAGDGVAPNPREAESWYLKAAAEGNAIAEFKLSDSFRGADAAYASDVVRVLSSPVENRRIVAAADKAAVEQLVARDPFFEMPAGAGRADYNYRSSVRDRMDGVPGGVSTPRAVSCAREGRLAKVTFKYSQLIDYDADGQAVLGGLLPLREKIATGFARSYPTELVQVRAVHGQPFPLVPGKRFGMEFSRMNGYAGPEVTPQSLSCVADAPTAEGTPLTCVYQNEQYRTRYYLARFIWSESSGCFVQRYESAGGKPN
ncbi:MAG: hypothetical protein EOO28_21490 [Comamonadaceae bacterium]|nr:MAG: hypothetical protein EOO28_21490 [Comamonadaceae bacterium]